VVGAWKPQYKLPSKDTCNMPPLVQRLMGPPGTGKTSEILKKIEELLASGVPKARIAFVTFTVAGAEEGASRAQKKFGGELEEYIFFRTLHSLCFRELKLSRANVMDQRKFRLFAKCPQLSKRFLGYTTEDRVSGDDRFLFFDQLYRNNKRAGIDFQWSEKLPPAELHEVRKIYDAFKRHIGAYDFTDMLEQFIARNLPVPVDYAFVDEAQDLTSLQWRAVDVAFSTAKILFIGGDDDQMIYEFSGADIHKFLHLKSDLPPIYLKHSHRLPESVLQVARSVTDQISDRIDKPYEGTGKEGSVAFVNDVEDVVFDPTKTYYFLARNNAFLSAAEAYLRKRGIIFEDRNKASVSISDFRLIRQWEQLRSARGELPSWMSPMGQNLIEGAEIKQPWYEAFAWEEDDIVYYKDLIDKATDTTGIIAWDALEARVREPPKVRLSSIHRAKGKEADVVVLFLAMSRKTWSTYRKNPDSELRVLYVGVTRAKESLIMVHSKTKYEYSLLKDGIGRDGRKRSPFEAPEKAKPPRKKKPADARPGAREMIWNSENNEAAKAMILGSSGSRIPKGGK